MIQKNKMTTNIFIGILFLTILMIFSGCNLLTEAVSNPTETPTPTNTFTTTPSPPPSATATPEPTATNTPTPTITLTPTPIPSPTPTFDPELMGTHNRTVIIGEDGWMYLNNRVYRNICHNSIEWGHFQTYADRLDLTNEFLESRGIEFAVGFIPEKCHVYSEEVQFLLWDVDGENATIPMIEYLTNNSDALVISYFETLNAHKYSTQVFYKNDNHWSAIGAYLAYQETVANLLPDTDPEDMVNWNYKEDYRIELREGDMGKASGLPQFLYEPAVLPDHDPLLEPISLDSGDLLYENPEADNDLTLVVFHDSFFGIPPIAEYLATHYQRTVYMSVNWGTPWSSDPDFLEALIEQWDPDVILVVSVERFLKRFLK